MTPPTLRAERVRRGWSQHRLGVALGYAPGAARSAVSRLESGESIAPGMQARLRELFREEPPQSR